jgi:hypothetical protein
MSRWPRWTRWPGGVLVGPRKDTTAIARTHVIVRLNHFNLTDIVPVGYAIFAVALGICAGTLQRRTLPALAVALAGFAGLRLATALWLRLHYMTPVTTMLVCGW